MQYPCFIQSATAGHVFFDNPHLESWAWIIIAILCLFGFWFFLSAIIYKSYKWILRAMGLEAEEIEISHKKLLKYIQEQKKQNGV
jgi:hypothetical protein